MFEVEIMIVERCMYKEKEEEGKTPWFRTPTLL